MKVHKPKTINEAIKDLEVFLHADLPSKIFPEKKISNEVWVREDYFKNINEVRDYIGEHFKLFKKQISSLNKEND